jgi:predicted pyridoxine 5'-phosphate oxidase superfamily flavin-nucleotide-binding protein
MTENRPGSAGEHELQERFGTFKRAAAFYDKQMLDHISPLMREYLARQEMVFIATADANGECDASFRAGPPGFVRVLDDRTLMYPEYKGNGVMASLGNISENGHVGLVFVDFFQTGVGLHVNGRATIVENEAVEAFAPTLARMAGIEQMHPEVADTKKTPARWVVVDVVEAYIHCSKHIPILAKLPGDAGKAPGSGDHFEVKDAARPWVATEPAREAPRPEEEFVGVVPAREPDELDALVPPPWVLVVQDSADASAPDERPAAPRTPRPVRK